MLGKFFVLTILIFCSEVLINVPWPFMSNVHSFSDTYTKAHKLALEFFSQGNGESQLTVVPIGNCHIDTAWLWPYGETIRKCARSWSSTVLLLEEYSFMQFACSQVFSSLI